MSTSAPRLENVGRQVFRIGKLSCSVATDLVKFTALNLYNPHAHKEAL